MPPIDIAAFRKRAENPALDQSQLEALRENAARGGGEEYASIVDEVLAKRFPSARGTAGTGTPTTVTLLGAVSHFGTGKDAYLWLIEKLLSLKSDLLENYEPNRRRKESAGTGWVVQRVRDSAQVGDVEDVETFGEHV